jgi:hypothetical protein
MSSLMLSTAPDAGADVMEGDSEKVDTHDQHDRVPLGDRTATSAARGAFIDDITPHSSPLAEGAIPVSVHNRLEHVRSTLGLSDDELARMANIDGLVELSVAFERRFLLDRIPMIVRTPRGRLGGKTVLQVLEESGVDAVHDYLKRLFSYIPQGFPSLRRVRIEEALHPIAVRLGLGQDVVAELAAAAEDSMEHRRSPEERKRAWAEFIAEAEAIHGPTDPELVAQFERSLDDTEFRRKVLDELFELRDFVLPSTAQEIDEARRSLRDDRY